MPEEIKRNQKRKPKVPLRAMRLFLALAGFALTLLAQQEGGLLPAPCHRGRPSLKGNSGV
jgi:hypothetical protein